MTWKCLSIVFKLTSFNMSKPEVVTTFSQIWNRMVQNIFKVRLFVSYSTKLAVFKQKIIFQLFVTNDKGAFKKGNCIKFGIHKPTCIIFAKTIDYCFKAILEKKLLPAWSRNSYVATSTNDFHRDVQRGN